MLPWRLRGPKRWGALFLAGLGLAWAIAACSRPPIPGGSATAAPEEVELTLVSFAVTKAAHEAIIPKFVEQWQRDHDQIVRVRRSYGASGSQTRAVIDGLDADVVHLALALDTEKIEKAGLIEPGWEQELPNNSVVSQSVAVIVTREGNPKNIQRWEDLTRDGVQLITADPKTSGAARWNFLALWGAAIADQKSPSEAQKFVQRVYGNAPILARDAREASAAFLKQGQGDAMINYENEIILANQLETSLPYVVPSVNVSIDNPIAVVDQNVDKHGNREVAEAFVRYLFTPEAQREFAKVGFRPVDPGLRQDAAIMAQYPAIETLYEASDFGDWDTIQAQFFADGAVFDQIQDALRR